jgi:hypothetical protein
MAVIIILKSNYEHEQSYNRLVSMLINSDYKYKITSPYNLHVKYGNEYHIEEVFEFKIYDITLYILKKF